MTSSTLHDRFALPFYLQADLDTVLAELDAAGLGLEAPIHAMLRHDVFRFLGTLDAGHWPDWALSVDGVTLPLRPERDSRGGPQDLRRKRCQLCTPLRLPSRTSH